MKILVTGGTGFIGTALLEQLAKHHELVALSRTPQRAERARRLGVRVVPTSSAMPIPESLRRWPEVVVHLASEPLAGRWTWTRARKRRIVQSRVDDTAALVTALEEASDLRVFVNASGIGYYGDSGPDVVDESHGPGSGFIAEVTAARERAADPVQRAGVRLVHMRFGLVLHESGGYPAHLGKLRRMGLSGRLGPGTQGLSWIGREDAVALLRFALEHASLAGPVNACAPDPTTNGEFIATLDELSGPKGVALPAWLTKLAMGELGANLLAGQHVVPTRALRAGFRFRYPRVRDALLPLACGRLAPSPT